MPQAIVRGARDGNLAFSARGFQQFPFAMGYGFALAIFLNLKFRRQIRNFKIH